MRKLLLASTVALVPLVGAHATPLTLTGPQPGGTIGPQSTSNPCVIAGTNCSNPATFGYNNFTPNNAPAYNRYSTSLGGSNGQNVAEGVQGTPYNALALATAAGGVIFDIAIDVNTAGSGETLDLFEVIDTTTGVTLYSYALAQGAPTLIGNVNANGNGYGDWLLSSINLNVTGVHATDGILFHAQWSGATDGAESFFIVNGHGGLVINPTLVDAPEPASLALLGVGLLGLGFLRHRKQV